ncbi:hypothetical protein RDI58_002998 [Solanum bulbocastanum]|uniref:Uncharacterized protein n=1 Tax=Solanum bulbocastanum TaxID=147425 RepID=A0AAN8YPH6_SOLBU
MLSKSSSCS